MEAQLFREKLPNLSDNLGSEASDKVCPVEIDLVLET